MLRAHGQRAGSAGRPTAWGTHAEAFCDRTGGASARAGAIVTATATAYPVAIDGESERRFPRLLAELMAVLEMNGYPPVGPGADRDALADAMFRFLHLERDQLLGQIEARLNGLHAPLRSHTAPGPLSSADCCAAAHEMRRLKEARLVLVVAIGAPGDDVLHMGTAADRGSALDEIAERMLDAVGQVAAPGGDVVESRVFDIAASGGAS